MKQKTQTRGRKTVVFPMQQNHDVMTVEDVAIYIKMSISYIYKNLDKIPHKRVGGNIRFHKPTVDAWLAAGSVVPIADLRSKVDPKIQSRVDAIMA
jgi:excisionase family DNA binding protein